MDLQRYNTDLKLELGDVLWYISEICSEIGCTMEEVMAMNIDKLKARKKADTLKGSGDSR